VTDIAGAAEIAHAAGALLAVDSTAVTPVLSRPLALGADLVMHSATKYLNGHSDVIAGTLTTAREDAFWARLCSARSSGGAILGGFEAYLLLRGMRTLFPRVERACRSAQQIAEALLADPRLSAVLYPGLTEHPGHAVAARQVIGAYGGMLSIRVRDGAQAAIAAAARVGSGSARPPSVASRAWSSTVPRSKAPIAPLCLICSASRSGSRTRATSLPTSMSRLGLLVARPQSDRKVCVSYRRQRAIK